MEATGLGGGLGAVPKATAAKKLVTAKKPVTAKEPVAAKKLAAVTVGLAGTKRKASELAGAGTRKNAARMVKKICLSVEK
jgi:hypothetical protein